MTYKNVFSFQLSELHVAEKINKLGDELVELWDETKIRCDKIENLIKQIKETEK